MTNKKSLQQQLEEYCVAGLGKNCYGKITMEITCRLINGKLTELHLKDGQRERTIKEERNGK